MKFFAKTDIGTRRTNNEDSYYVNDRHKLFMVADGMGGHEAGEIASEIAKSVFQKWAETTNPIADRPPNEELKLLKSLVSEVNQKIRADKHSENMGTTVTAGFIQPSNLSYVHVGDSRIYHLRGDQITQLTTDHSHVQELIRAGNLTPEEARTHPKRNIINRAVGINDKVEIDSALYPIEVGDIILACTDGLHDTFPSDREIATNISATLGDLNEACKTLVKTALDNGGYDNITALIVQVDENS